MQFPSSTIGRVQVIDVRNRSFVKTLTTNSQQQTPIMETKMPQKELISSVTNKNAKCHCFHYAHISTVSKSLSFLLDAFHYCFVKHFTDVLFIKQLLKAFTKLHCKNARTMSARRIPVNGGPNPSFENF